MQTTSTWAAMGCLLMAMASSAANAQNTAFRLINNTQFIVSEVYFCQSAMMNAGRIAWA